MQVEAVFRTSNVKSDDTKFDYVLTALDVNAATDISDLLSNPPDENKYDSVKKALIDRLAISEAARIQQILSNEQMGDRTPSQHLRHLRALAGSNFSDAALTSIWLEGLPHELRAVVAGVTALDLEKQAEVADRVMDVSGCRRSISAVASASSSSVENQISALAKQISALNKHFTQGPATPRRKQQRKQNSRPNTPLRQLSPTSSTSSTSSDNSICWYHRKYGRKARKCEPFCNWSSSNPSSSSGNGPDQQ